MDDYRLHFKHKETQKWLNVDVHEKDNKVVASAKGKLPDDFEITANFYEWGEPGVFGNALEKFSFEYDIENSSTNMAQGVTLRCDKETNKTDLIFAIPVFRYIRPFQGFDVDAFIKSVEESGAVRER